MIITSISTRHYFQRALSGISRVTATSNGAEQIAADAPALLQTGRRRQMRGTIGENSGPIRAGISGDATRVTSSSRSHQTHLLSRSAKGPTPL